MNRKILPVKPISQLFPIPMVMGCEGVSAAMMLQYNNQHILSYRNYETLADTSEQST